MKHFSASDYYELRRLSSFSGEYTDVLTALYLPLTGVSSIGVYLCLQDIASRKEHELLHIDRLLSKVGLTIGQLERALTSLEATGLIRTFAKKEGDASYFVFCLFAPLKGEEFVSDVLMYGALASALGEEEAEKLRKRFAMSDLPTDLEEVTISFPEYFPISDNLKIPSKKKTKKINTGFDAIAFVKELKKYGVNEKALSDEEIETIGKLAALYHLDEATMASFAYDCLTLYRSGRATLNQKELEQKCQRTAPFNFLRSEKGEKSQVSGDSALASLIQLADRCTALEFLSYLQNGHKPAASDVRLVQKLSVEIGLPDPVISVLLSYVLQVNDNILSASYCEKVGASLQRAGCLTARDAADYLFKTSKKKKKKTPVQETTVTNEEKKETPESDEDVDALLSDLFGEEDDKK